MHDRGQPKGGSRWLKDVHFVSVSDPRMHQRELYGTETELVLHPKELVASCVLRTEGNVHDEPDLIMDGTALCRGRSA